MKKESKNKEKKKSLKIDLNLTKIHIRKELVGNILFNLISDLR